MSEDDRWRRVKALFQATVERPAGEREAFLAAEDVALRQDVEALLAADAHGPDLDERLRLLIHAGMSTAGSVPGLRGGMLAIDRRVGAYDVVGLLGAGAMGEVYRARDTKLNRDVALKVVPDLLALEPDHLSRVTREAQLLASLNHPNIDAIYGLEESDGVQILVLELVDGQTLAERVARGPLPVVEALALARQVAEALGAAHRKAITHRDLKPANIKVAEDGTVKVLDFGLARSARSTEERADVRGGQRAGASDSAPGLIMGSPAYMSPEQARGSRVDTRTDIWAFGCLLYELLTGKRAFDAESVSDTIAAVQQREPDWALLPAATPAGIRTLMRRCLEKDPARRLSTIDEACRVIALERQEPRRRRIVGLVAAALLLLALGAGGWMVRRAGQAQWARNVAIPRIGQLAAADDHTAAFALAREVSRITPDDPLLATLWPQFSAAISLTTLPEGGDVYVAPYSSPDGPWQHLGRTPISAVRVPIGVLQIRVEKDGYEPLRLAAANPSTLLGNATNRLAAPLVYALAPAHSTHGMVSVPGGAFPVSLNAFSTTEPIALDPFMIDRYEVTNEQYQRFVDAGGYDRADYWQGLPFEIAGQSVPWVDAVAQFGDSTGAPGPSTWASGRYPPGAGDHPVGGVSWYEAVAFCRSRGQMLPTIFHWRRAALSPDEMFAPLAPAKIAHSNFGHRGPVAVGTFRGLGPYGTYDMAGNVKEWSWNEAGAGHRWIQGGSWSDQAYMLVVRDSAPASDRAPTNGFRCAQYGGAPVSDALLRLVPLNRARTTQRSAPVPELFEAFKSQYLPIKAPLNPRVESTDTGGRDWVREKISFDAGYEGARVPAYVFLPKQGKPPYQVVVYFPGRSSFVGKSSSGALQPDFLDFVLKSGRAVVWPIYNGSYERWIPTATPSVAQRRLLYDWRQDIARLLDVLSERTDIDAGRTAYLGLSYGASVPVSLLSLEDRFKAVVLMSAALGGVPGFPDADALNYARHITAPVLLLSGRHDFVYPVETVAIPMFDRLGTPAERKRHVVFDAGHMMFPRGPMAQEILAWLDLYLGPVPPS